MVDAGCRFQGLEIHHPHPSWLGSVLESIGAGDLVKIHSLERDRVPYLEAHIKTPKGAKVLRSIGVESPLIKTGRGEEIK
jgi:hypothetical protein